MRFDCELRAVQVSCGFHHSGTGASIQLCGFNWILSDKEVTLIVSLTVVLMENGDVYTFGYGQHGQLGHGDVNSRYDIIVFQYLLPKM